MDDHARLQALLAQSECETLRSDALANTYCFSGVCETEFMALIGRFSRARKGSPETALQFLREDVAWRNARFVPDLRLKHPREVLGVDPKEVAEYYERRLLGMDVAGRPVYYQNYQHLVVRKLLEITPIESLELYHIWEQERAVSLLDEVARLTQHSTPGTMGVVLDLSGMSLRKHVNSDFLRFVKIVSAIDQDHYPERMGLTFIINAPRAFGVVWSVVKPWLDARTAEKIRIYSTESTWRPAIRECMGDTIADALATEANLDDVTADELVDVRWLATSLVLAGSRSSHSSEKVDVEVSIAPTLDEDDFYEAQSPAPSDEELAKVLLSKPITACGVTLAANTNELAMRVEYLVRIKFVFVLGSLVCSAIVTSNEARRAPFLAIVTSLAAVPFGAVGIAGARRRNAGLLSVHDFGTALVATAFLGLGISFFVASFTQHSVAFFRGSQSTHHARLGYITLGCVCLTVFTSACCETVASSKLATRLKIALFNKLSYAEVDNFAAYRSDMALRRTTAKPKVEGKVPSFYSFAPGLTSLRGTDIERNFDMADAQLRHSLWACSLVILSVAVAGIAYGAASTAYFVRRGIGASSFVPYLLLQSSVAHVVVGMVAALATVRDERAERARLPGETTATRLRRLVNSDLRFVFELRLYRKLVAADVALCASCAALALSRTVSVPSIVRRDGDHRPQVAKTASLALVIIASIEALAIAALVVSSTSADVLIAVRRRMCRIRKHQLIDALRSRLGDSPHHSLDSHDDDQPIASLRARRSHLLIEARKCHGGSSDNSPRRSSVSTSSAFLSHHRIRTERAVKDEDTDATTICKDINYKDIEMEEEKSNYDKPDFDEATELLALAETFPDVEENGSFAKGFAHLSFIERATVAWATGMGFAHVFLDGTYAIFNALLRKHGDDNDRGVPWFLVLWRAYGKVDSRYRHSDSFIVTQVAALALVAGPICLCHAWATYELKPWRHALGLTSCCIQYWTLALYIGTGAHAGFSDFAPTTSVVYFWLGFVLTTLIRLALPLPVFRAAIAGIIQDSALSARWANVQYLIMEDKTLSSLHETSVLANTAAFIVSQPPSLSQKVADEDDANLKTNAVD